MAKYQGKKRKRGVEIVGKKEKSIAKENAIMYNGDKENKREGEWK